MLPAFYLRDNVKSERYQGRVQNSLPYCLCYGTDPEGYASNRDPDHFDKLDPDPDPDQSDEQDPVSDSDPHQLAEYKSKCMKYDPI
jgi:hypothetical protein